jgi:PiT family inorganic phosphate transporter
MAARLSACSLRFFVAALVCNVGTWWLGLPNSSSHALIGALIGIAIGNSIKHARGFGAGVDWSQVKSVLSALLLSPIIGFVLALIIFTSISPGSSP